MTTRVLMVAGEASADSHAARLLHSLRESHADLEVYGVGGASLAALGMDIVVRSESLNAVGLTDWMDRLSEVLGSFRKVAGLIETRRPDYAILLDLPDFNLRLAKKLKAAGIPVVYYISPQVWAWRRYRMRTIRRVVDKMLLVFPFEENFYRRYGVPATFVGHPLLDTIEPRGKYRSGESVRKAPRIGLLPGSRLSELSHHGTLLDGVIRIVREKYPHAEFRVPVASTLNEAQIRAHIRSEGVELVEGGARSVYEWADCALIASGTATLEAALVGIPFALYYRVSGVSAFALRFLIRYQGFLGMPNLLLKREAVKEFFQSAATPERLAADCIRLVESKEGREACVRSLKECRSSLGGPGASRRAAAEVAAFWRSVGTVGAGGGGREPLPA
jgi:lipid-A-disaccharide synthase